ncbi:MAG: 1,4-alpha-glucan branching protein domain-containing protein, partial [Actinomycetota bacterium]
DTELLGHWWFEGPLWLEEVLRTLWSHAGIRPVTLEAAADGPRPSAATLRESSWGTDAGFGSWFTPETEDMHKRLSDAEAEAEHLLATAAPGHAAAQLVRELFLLQSSDWPYLVIAGRNPDYARSRFDAHLDRFGAIADAIRDGDSTRAAHAGAAAFEIDNLLPAIRGLPGEPGAWEDAAHPKP